MVKAFIDTYEDYNVHVIPCRDDNYTFILEKNKKGILIDCSLYETVHNYLKKNQIKLDVILITHHHYDHVDGIKELSDEHKCRILCSEVDYKREAINKPSSFLIDQEKIVALDLEIMTLDTPGHTAGHISFYIESLNLLFCADTLFSLGCGKVFSDGSFEKLYSSLKKIALLPSNTIIYCAHEYTLLNADFLKSKNLISDQTISSLQQKFNSKGRTIPSSLDFELKYNKFLKSKNYEEFFRLRTQKDLYR